MYSSATATGCSAHTSSTAAATRRWGAPGTTSTSRRSAVRRPGRTRQRVILKLRRTSGGTGMTTTTRSPRLTRSGSISQATLKEPPPEGAPKRRKRAKEGDHFAAFEDPSKSQRGGAPALLVPKQESRSRATRPVPHSEAKTVESLDNRKGSCPPDCLCNSLRLISIFPLMQN